MNKKDRQYLWLVFALLCVVCVMVASYFIWAMSHQSYKLADGVREGEEVQEDIAAISDSEEMQGELLAESGASLEEERVSLIQQGENCFFSYCLESEDITLDEQGNKITTQTETNELGYSEKEVVSTLYANKELFTVDTQEMMSHSTLSVRRLGDLYVHLLSEANCGGSSYTQTLYDSMGYELQEDFIPEGIPERFHIGDILYSLSLSIDDEHSHNAPTHTNANKDVFDYTFTPGENPGTYLENLATKEEKKIYENYILSFEGYENMKFLYSADIERPERVVWLGTDADYLSENIRDEGMFYDLAVTNKIISYYSDGMMAFFDKDGNQIKQVRESDLPVFRMMNINQTGDYAVYIAETSDYEINSMAEMCKPAIYVYNETPVSNSVSIASEKGSYFTKLIPEFTQENTWNFHSSQGKVEVENTLYDYLYYAIKVRNYEHNRDGWVIEGSRARAFFEDTLAKINFNEQETRDFLEFWIEKYEPGKHYFVSYKYNDDIEQYVQLEFEREPSREFRVLLDSYEILDYAPERYSNFLYSEVGDRFDRYLIERFERNMSEYEVFEWGGVLQTRDDYIIY